MQTVLGFPERVKMDLDRLVCGGHSFGGITGISVTAMDSRVKACVVQDPWLYAYHNEINKGELFLKVPLFTVST